MQLIEATLKIAYVFWESLDKDRDINDLRSAEQASSKYGYIMLDRKPQKRDELWNGAGTYISTRQ